VSGETGSGKTTQVPQYLLDDMIDRGVGSEAYIVCTQPRRIAALSVAERVSSERKQAAGPLIVGSQVRFQSEFSHEHTRILFCTTGILLRKLQNPDYLRGVSHVFLLLYVTNL
jgi:ATP-dependent RNA helicase DHX29